MWRVLHRLLPGNMRNKLSQNAPAPTGNQHLVTQGQPVGATPQPGGQGWHADEKQHRADEKDYWRQSVRASRLATLIGAVAAGAAGTAGVFAYLALTASQSQLAETQKQTSLSIAQLRPRVTLRIDVGDPTEPEGMRFFTPVWHNAGSIEPADLTGCVRIGLVPAQTLPGSQGGYDLPCTDTFALRRNNAGDYQQASVPISRNDAEELLSGRQRVLIWGFIQYEEPFIGGGRRRHDWCHLVIATQSQGRSQVFFPDYRENCNQSR